MNLDIEQRWKNVRTRWVTYVVSTRRGREGREVEATFPPLLPFPSRAELGLAA